MDEEKDNEFVALPPSSIGIAVDGKKSSMGIVYWALEKFGAEYNVIFKLLHVRPKDTKVPTPMGNYIPISSVREEVAAAYRQEMESNAKKMLLPYKQICSQKKTTADIVVIESDDIPRAIAKEVAERGIQKLVIGASSNIFSFGKKTKKLSSRISSATPTFCTVYAISNETVSFIRPCNTESDRFTGISNTASRMNGDSVSSSTSSPPAFAGKAVSIDGFDAIFNRETEEEVDYQQQSSCSSSGIGGGTDLSSISNNYPIGSMSWDHGSNSYGFPGQSPSASNDLDMIQVEIEKLRIELRHTRGMYAIAQNETVDASIMLDDLGKRCTANTEKLKAMIEKENEAKELVRHEREKLEEAEMDAENLKDLVVREALRRREAEINSERGLQEREKLESALRGTFQQYQTFSWEEIVSATSSFSETLKVGVGSYGTVYKCRLHHTAAAVKIFHSRENSDRKQLQKEIEILSRIHHPNLLILLGACPEQGCIVYEYMENGSLEDRLRRVNKTPPLPWKARFRIAWEVGSALVYLHKSKPKPVIHRDLKPGNILLDSNFVSKIGDVGVSTMLSLDPFSISATTIAGPVGTMCYIDPEEQRTGLITPQSDVYAFGIVILQLLTGKSPLGLTHLVEKAVYENRLEEVLDMEAGTWPIPETQELAAIGLSCAEMRRKDRPDLEGDVLHKLERLHELASISQSMTPPAQFICPITHDLMNDPCVAADGYTYDRRAIHQWLQENDSSPMTILPLANKDLLPNYNLLSAIMEWRSRNP